MAPTSSTASASGRSRGRAGEIEVPPAPDLEPPVRPARPVGGGERGDPGQAGAGRHRRPERHRLLQAARVQRPVGEATGHQRLGLGAEGQDLARDGGVEGQDADAVAGQPERAVAWIPQREGKLSVEAIQAGDAPAPEGGQDHLGVGARPERVLAQLLAQLDVVEDLAVVDDGDPGGGIAHGLGAALQVEDGQPGVPERHPVEEQAGLGVRPAVVQGRRHGAQAGAEDRLAPVPGHARRRGESRDAAHPTASGRALLALDVLRQPRDGVEVLRHEVRVARP